jgi:23S rRNA pseudouridine1911/1915/1917 synthase
VKDALEKKNYSVKAGAPAPVRLIVPPECAGLRLDQALARLLPDHSRSRLTTWIRDRQVLVDGAPAEPKQRVRGAETLEVQPAADPRAQPYLPEAIPLDILYEDEALLVVNKPAGLVVHPGSGNWAGTMLNALLDHAPALSGIPRAGIVHRLDKETSGLLVVAKTLVAQTSLVRQLQERTVKREYVALAQGRITRDDTISEPIGRHPRQRTRMAVTPRGKPAVTHYEVVASYARATRLRCRLETGRTHQIRVHLAAIGHPLIGDPVYGTRGRGVSAAVFGRQALHAEKLALVHPVSGAVVSWRAPLPADLKRLITVLKAEA